MRERPPQFGFGIRFCATVGWALVLAACDNNPGRGCTRAFNRFDLVHGSKSDVHRYVDRMVVHCTRDHWSFEMADCIWGVRDEAELDRCVAKYLTTEQARALMTP